MLTYQSLIEQLEIQPFCNIVDSQGTSNDATTGDWLKMVGERCLILLVKEAGADGDDPVITVSQATTSSGGSSKGLQFKTIYTKISSTSVQSVGTWTKVTQSAASTYTNTDSAQAYGLIAIEITADMLDADGGFDYINVTCADTGSGGAQFLTFLAIFGNLRYGGAAANHQDSTA